MECLRRAHLRRFECGSPLVFPLTNAGFTRNAVYCVMVGGFVESTVTFPMCTVTSIPALAVAIAMGVAVCAVWSTVEVQAPHKLT